MLYKEGLHFESQDSKVRTTWKDYTGYIVIQFLLYAEYTF